MTRPRTTISTKRPLTNQIIFDRVVRHLRKQGKRAYNPELELCEYLTPDGLRCAAGCLLWVREYNPEMEAKAVSKMGNLWPARLRPFNDLVQALQLCHDKQWDPEKPGSLTWALAEVARDFKLDIKALSGCRL